MKVLILGAGGREHALAWAVKRSERVTEIVCAPGNGGMAQIARCVPVDLKNLNDMVRVAESEQPGLTIVGPEGPLALGIVDALEARGLRVFGPSQEAARLESSKAFAKQFMKRHKIPTANYAVCTNAKELEEAVKDAVKDAALRTEKEFGDAEFIVDFRFQKGAKDLDLAQASLLAGIPQAPTDWDPITHPTLAAARQQQVLDAMVSQGDISP